MSMSSLAISSLIGIVLCVTVSVVSGQCKDRPNGYVFEITGCWKAKICQGGNATELICKEGTVYERDSGTCKPIGEGNTACGTPIDCRGKTDGAYGDDNCQTFYWCISQTSYGRNYCSGRLLFDGERCNYPWDVPPPCGTLVVETTTAAPTTTPATTKTTKSAVTEVTSSSNTTTAETFAP